MAEIFGWGCTKNETSVEISSVIGLAYSAPEPFGEDTVHEKNA